MAAAPGTRFDVSGVPLQGAYVAKRCPVRAQHDHDRSIPVEPLPERAADRVRMDAGNDFEAMVFGEVEVQHEPDAVTIEDDAPSVMVQATVAAMQAGVRVILGGWLPNDTEARRVGKPDVLVRVGRTDLDGWGYVPVDVKHHTLARWDDPKGHIRAHSLLADLDPLTAQATPGVSWSQNYVRQDGFQLAHYWRMLEACGFAPSPHVCPPTGAIIDKTLHAWWIDLQDPTWKRWWAEDPVSLLGWYDHEYAFRLDVIARALAHNDDPSVELLVSPVRITECDRCPWDAVCTERLEAADHVSLLPRTTFESFVRHRRHGVLTRRQMADLHWDTAWVAQGPATKPSEYDLSTLHGDAALADPATPIEQVVGSRRTVLIARLQECGVHTAADVARLHPTTAALAGKGSGHLPTLIDQARALVVGRAFRARGLEHLDVPRGDIEIDLDMENTLDGVYLWGTHTTVRVPNAPAHFVPGYRPFVHWDQPVSADRWEVEAQVTAEALRWIDSCRTVAAEAGLTVRVYCWSSAEEQQFRRIGALASAAGAGPDVYPLHLADDLLRSDSWVDLYELFKTQLVTGRSNGLKTVAAMAGFAWRDENPSGDESQAWYQQAVGDPDPAVREAMQERLLTYNEDDVLATLAVRDWLTNPTNDFPAIEDWAPSPT